MTVIVSTGSTLAVTDPPDLTIAGDFALGALSADLLNINIGTLVTPATLSETQSPACYAAGTMIRTAKGDMPVERLKPRDLVHTHFAGIAPVVWIGHRHVDCRRHPDPARVWPVRIRAHAFSPRVPLRDVLLSPDHAVFVDAVLIPIRHLINDTSILQERCDTVTYYHIELGEHDVVFAENLPAETYLDSGDRAVFDNAGAHIALHPTFGARRWEAFGCAPLVVTGPKLDAVVAALRARIPRGKRPIRRRRPA